MSENDSDIPVGFDPDEIDDRRYEAHECLNNGDGFGAVGHFTWLVAVWTSIEGVHGEQTMVERAFLARAKALAGLIDDAIADQRQLVFDRTAVFGPDADITLSTRGQLAQTLARNGYPAEAIEVNDELLADRIRLVGADHPSVFNTMGNLAENLLIAGDDERGLEVYTELFERRFRVMGATHPDTLRTAGNLAVARSKNAGTPEKALEILVGHLDEMTDNYGWESAETCTARGHIAELHMRNFSLDVFPVLQSLIHDRTEWFGPWHPDTMRSIQMAIDASVLLDDDDPLQDWVRDIALGVGLMAEEEQLAPGDHSSGGEPSPMFSAERQSILTNLELDAGITRGVHGPAGPTVPLSQNSARSWARLVSATVQAWHNNLGDPANRLQSPYDDDMFTYNMLESILSIPEASWSRLTDARRVCFVADLGELLMVISELSGGDITARSAGALGMACNGDPDLISIAEQAGLNLPYRNGLAEFTWGVSSIRSQGGN
jgi:hypothetical protein